MKSISDKASRPVPTSLSLQTTGVAIASSLETFISTPPTSSVSRGQSKRATKAGQHKGAYDRNTNAILSRNTFRAFQGERSPCRRLVEHGMAIKCRHVAVASMKYAQKAA
eukprot:760719-Hanusia_phi.AAC.2